MFRRCLAFVCLCGALSGCASGLSEQRARVLASAESLIGTPYRYGGSDRSGLDCSGLVQLSYAAAGVPVPRTAAELLRRGRPRAEPEPGDLLVFSDTEPGKPTHVGIYAGEDRMIHASSNRGQVLKTDVRTPYWQRHLIGGVSYLGG